MGFFDRPAKGEEVQALLADPPIPGLTEPIAGLDKAARRQALARLRRLHLLVEAPLEDPDAMDTHPIVREYLARRLELAAPEASKEGHRRLWEHLKQASKGLPETLEEMTPLYQAVFHGCRAGREQGAFDEVYLPRILRDDLHYSLINLGAFGAELSMLSSFFERIWSQPKAGLSAEAKSFVLNATGYCLRALGRIHEAQEPMMVGLDIDRSLSAQEEENDALAELLKNRAIQAGNPSELYLLLGRLSEAVERAQEAVEFAHRSPTAPREYSAARLWPTRSTRAVCRPKPLPCCAKPRSCRRRGNRSTRFSTFMGHSHSVTSYWESALP